MFSTESSIFFKYIKLKYVILSWSELNSHKFNILSDPTPRSVRDGITPTKVSYWVTANTWDRPSQPPLSCRGGSQYSTCPQSHRPMNPLAYCRRVAHYARPRTKYSGTHFRVGGNRSVYPPTKTVGVKREWYCLSKEKTENDICLALPHSCHMCLWDSRWGPHCSFLPSNVGPIAYVLYCYTRGLGELDNTLRKDRKLIITLTNKLY